MSLRTILFFWALTSCYHHVQSPLIDIIGVEATPQDVTFPDQKRLQIYLQRHPRFAKVVEDVTLLLTADLLAKKGNINEALEVGRRSFKLAKGEMRKYIFKKYLALLASTNSDVKSPDFFVDRVDQHLGYSDKETKALVAEYLAGRFVSGTDDHLHPSANLVDLLHEDSTLARGAQRYCHAKTTRGEEDWQYLLASFPQHVMIYWQGLIATCLGHGQQALSYHYRYLNYSREMQIYPQFALTAAANIISIGRNTGKSRSWLADSYNRLATLWGKKSSSNHEAFNVTRADLLAKKINDLLWASRYSSLVGDYDKATSLAQESLREARTILESRPANAAEFKKFIAEALHILAFRVGVNREDYIQAIAYSNEALQYDLSDDWRERFLWYNGLYHYLSDDLQSAVNFWEKSLRLFPKSSIKPRLLFWLARANQKILATGDTTAESESERQARIQEYVVELETEHPLSYYTVLALPKISNRISWYEKHRRLYLQNSITENRGIELKKYRRSHKGIARNLIRAEIFIAAGLSSLAQVELQELEKWLASESLTRNTGIWLYLSRLYFASHRYVRSIDLITQLTEQDKSYWRRQPEQLLIYFPQPFLAIFNREAFAVNLEPELSLAISRQESAFRVKARSRARALGIMQMLPSTARKLAKEHGLKFGNIEDQLLQPALNIKLGTLYLRSLVSRYHGNLPAILAAYNAGEEVVNTWLRERSHSDPLMWIELIPFGETKNYVKKVYRNYLIYRFLTRNDDRIASIGN